MASTKALFLCLTLTLLPLLTDAASLLPPHFVYLSHVDPTIKQNIRYATAYNFMGRKVVGYQANTCILTEPAANALHLVQIELQQSNLGLMVYDCYRPQMAVNDFIQWSENNDQSQKKRFYPHVDKNEVFEQGYLAKRSGHTRGSAVDLTIITLPFHSAQKKGKKMHFNACAAAYAQRFQDGSIDMGTDFDCLDPRAHFDAKNISIVAHHHRATLRQLMEKYGFLPYPQEWWHFILKNEPFSDYFNFQVTIHQKWTETSKASKV